MMIDADQTPTAGSCLVGWEWRHLGVGPLLTATATLEVGTAWYTPTAGDSRTPLVVEEISIDCSGATAGDTQLDWLVLQNSKVPFSPLEDLELSWSDMDMPWGGFNTSITLRGGDRVQGTEALFQRMVAVLDVGGAAIYDDTSRAWQVANGTEPNWLSTEQDLKLSDIAWLENGHWLAVSGLPVSDPSGDTDRGIRGQLFHSTDQGDNWTPLYNSYSDKPTSPLPGPAVAADRRLHPWGRKDRPMGRLIEPADDSAAFIASHVEGQPALILRGKTGAAADVCTVAPTVLPQPVNLDGSIGENIVTSLAWIGDAAHGNVGASVLVGYRQRDLTGGSGLALSPDHSQLFAFTPTGRGKYYSEYPSTWRITTCEASGDTTCTS
jgi:hypothetical protein